MADSAGFEVARPAGAAQVTEIVNGIYRICQPPQNYPIGFNQFLIDDDRATLIHTGFYQSYEASPSGSGAGARSQAARLCRYRPLRIG